MSDRTHLAAVLKILVRGIEQEHPTATCSVMLLDTGGTRLVMGAAPGLPSFFNQAVDGQEIGPSMGSCGSAAFTGQRVVVSDIQTDPLWSDHRELAARAGLGACWAEPIFGIRKQVIGVFAMYYRLPTEPTEAAIKSMVTAAQFAALAIERVHTEKALRLNSQLLHATQSVANVGGWELDVLTGDLFWTAETYRIHDTSPAEYNPTVDAGIGYFLPESRRLISEAMRNAVERGDGYDLVLETLTIKGRRIDVRTTCEVTMRDGRAVMLTGTFQDITEREAAKSVMLQSKQKLATAMSLTQMADWEFDLESGAFHFNDRAYVLFGTSAAKEGGYEMPAETFLRQFCHPNDAAYVGEHITRAISNPPEGTQTLEYRLIRRDDGALQHMVAHYQVQAGELGRGVWAVGSVLDVTARKRAQLAHVESENQLRVVIDSAMDAIVILDGSQNIVLFNAAAERMFGFAAAEMLGQPLDRLIPASRREAHHGHIDRMAVTPIMGVTMGRMRDEITALRADGTDFPIEVSISTIYSGETPLYVGVARDITVRKRDEAERLAMEVHLQQAQRLDSIGQLAGGVAHDFNNMLNVILVTAELALENVSPGDELHGDLIEILTAAQRSAGLTRQLLAFARQEAIAPKVLNLNSTIEGMLSMLRKVIGEDLQLIWAPETMLGHVMMDPSQVDQILVNLCLNARDSIAGVGSVSISTSMVTLDEATFHGETTSISGLFVRLTVSDTGSGMDTSTLQRIFEPFFTTKDTGQGTGLGLSTVYGIVKQNGGAIDVISSPGAGAAFSVFLPPIDASERKSGSGVAPGSSPSGGETLLIVDDEQAMLVVCKRVLVAYGHKVLTASTPAEAMRLAEKHADELSLLIIDVIMPKMTGRELSDLLMSRVPHLKCLFMSGYTADIIATRGVLEPDVAFIQKPFSPDVLAARVRGVLDRQA